MAKKSIVKVDEVKIDSLIKKNFSEEFMKKVYDVYSDKCMSIVKKTQIFDEIFTKEFGDRKDYRRIGEGTNRFVCLLDNHIIKVAYNYLAYIDNMNELAMAKNKPKRLARAYETNGIILVSEYVTVMDKEDFLESQTEIQGILTTLEADIIPGKKPSAFPKYILGDMGMSDKNYGNWGRRTNGDIVVLDYGYLYKTLAEDWKEIARCPICGSSLVYSESYSDLKCSKDECPGAKSSNSVKYTTLRNNLGYAKIIDMVDDIIHDDKYVKFNKNGSIKVDVMAEVIEEEEEKEEFKIPEEVEILFTNTKEKFFEIKEEIIYNGSLSIDRRYDLKNELEENKENYNNMLYPMLIGLLPLTHKDVKVYSIDFDIRYKEVYGDLYEDLEREALNIPENDDLSDLDDFDMTEEDEMVGYDIKSSTSNFKFIDTLANNEEEANVLSSLDELLSRELGGFNAPFMADDNEHIMDKISDDKSDEMGIEELLSIISNEMVNEEEEKDVIDDDKGDIEEELQEMYNKLLKATIELVSMVYPDNIDEMDFVEGDVYRTYLNGDKIDIDYSPEVNARNILGGWKPEEFAFPLYRHLLPMFDYDTDEVTAEFEARYRVGEEISAPSDIYDKIENRTIVAEQIRNRFEDDMAPSRSIIINNIGRELDLYYAALDRYYDEKEQENRVVDIDHPDYYLELSKMNTEMTKEMQEAKENLEDELYDYGMKLEDELEESKIVYYYDTEFLYNGVQDRLKDVIENMKLVNRDGSVKNNIKELILNKYFEEYREVVSDDVFDVFTYGNSYELETGNMFYKRVRKPILKAKLVPKESTEDTFKPKLFNRNKFTRIIVEQRFETILRDTAEDQSALAELISDLQKNGLCYHKSQGAVYNMKGTNDNIRYLLSESERDLYIEFNEIYSSPSIKDVKKTYAKAVCDMIIEGKELHPLTVQFMNTLATKGYNEAMAERSFLINVLEINGSMTRLELLKMIG